MSEPEWFRGAIDDFERARGSERSEPDQSNVDIDDSYVEIDGFASEAGSEVSEPKWFRGVIDVFDRQRGSERAEPESFGVVIDGYGVAIDDYEYVA